MGPYLRILLPAVVALPPLVYFFAKAQDKELAAAMLGLFGGFIADRCIDAFDRGKLSKDTTDTRARADYAVGQLTALSASVQSMAASFDASLARLRADLDIEGIRRIPLAEAFTYAQTRLKSASRMLNTSFSIRDGATTSTGYENWVAAIVEAVAHQGCVVHEVVASTARAQAVLTRLAGVKRHTGQYLVTDVSQWFAFRQPPPFIEFVVFEDRDGKEVVFGWSTSSDFAANQECFATRSPQVVAFFEAQFARLSSLGDKVGGRPGA